MRPRRDSQAAAASIIGVVLLVGITIALAATGLVIWLKWSDSASGPAPAANLDSRSAPGGNGIEVRHLAGDTLYPGAYEISVTRGAGSAPQFVECDVQLYGGLTLTAKETTPGSTCSGGMLSGSGDAITPGEYRLVIRSMSPQAKLIDTVVHVA